MYSECVVTVSEHSSGEAEKKKKDVLNRKFEELFERAKGDTSKPVRDIDLD